MKQLLPSRKSIALAAGIFALLAPPMIASAQQQVQIPQQFITNQDYPTAVLPMVICWNGGKKNLYIQTDASDPAIATQQGLNYVPELANAIDAPNGAVDDIYVFTNSTQQDQYNILPSEPLPVGPGNTNRSYSPLWQVSQVTWKAKASQKTLKSEEEVLSAEKDGRVTIEKTRIVINCPIVYTDAGGLLPKSLILLVKPDRSGLGVYRNR